MDGVLLKKWWKNKMRKLWEYDFFKYFWTFLKNNNPIRQIKNRLIKITFIKKAPLILDIKGWSYDIDIYIVAFNKPELIELQINILRRYLTDNYRLLVIDNSNNSVKSNEIMNICHSYEVSYVKLPVNRLRGSHSHWLALNYIMKNISNITDSKYIWFLDHDCFLVKKMSFVNILKIQDMWGLLIDETPLRIRNSLFNMAWNKRFLWPWCSFYKKSLFDKWYDFFPTKHIFPISFLDTWWWNRKYIYRFFKKDKLELLQRSRDENIKWSENIWNIFIHLWWAGYRDEVQVNDIFKNIKLNFLES